jgi:flagellar basal-body rod modification protein FlgD
MVSVASATAAATGNNAVNDIALNKLDGDFQSFLKLLTVQLQNQDPTEPLDTNQLTDQITQFSQVEQQINTNKSLQKMLAASQSSAINSAVSYIDRFVEYEGSEFYHRKGGAPILSYTLPEQADSVTVSITTESGQVLYSKDVTADGGNIAKVPHSIAWDGKDASGNPVASGKYKVNVVAKNSEGKDITASTRATDMVTEVAMVDGEIILSMGELDIKSSAVKTIKGLYAEVDVPETGNGGNTDETDAGSETTEETEGA